MKLAHTSYSMTVTWKENSVPILVIENPKTYRHLLGELRLQCDGAKGGFVLSKNWEPIDISKHCSLVTDPLFFDINNRQTNLALSKWLKTFAFSEHMYLLTQELKTSIHLWLEEIISHSQEHLIYSDEIDPLAIAKASSLKFFGDDTDLPERLLTYIKICQSFLKKDFFIFINLKQLLSQNELLSLYKDIFYQKANILLIERTHPYIHKGFESCWIIDQDDCEIYQEDI